MVRLAIIVGVIAVVFVIYSLVDSIVTDTRRIRALPKPVWVLITLIPIFGAILWLTLGKLRGTEATRASAAPDDDPEFLRTLGANRGSDSRIQDLEKRLAELDDDNRDEKKPEHKKPDPNKSEPKKTEHKKPDQNDQNTK